MHGAADAPLDARPPGSASVRPPPAPPALAAPRLPYPGEVVQLGVTTVTPPPSRRPTLANAEEVPWLVDRHYPRGARESRLGGAVVLSVLVDEAGRVREPRIARGNTLEELNVAALAVARELRFKPAQRSGKYMPARVELTLVFTP